MNSNNTQLTLRERLLEGHVIPAHPLALDANRRFDEKRQAGLTQYYLDSGAGGLAIGVHTTQFAIRQAGLLAPVLSLSIPQIRSAGRLAIAGVCGATAQASAEAHLAASLGYDAVLLSLGALGEASIEDLLSHCRHIAHIIPVIGFYLQPAVGGRLLPYRFWREFCEIHNVVAIKVAPFNRYQTLDVLRARLDSGRAAEIALYTGNDDAILEDLLGPFHGGLLGHWAVWTKRAVELLEKVKAFKVSGAAIPQAFLALAPQITDMNAAVFDAANHFHGCIAGINEVLHRQGLLDNHYCLDPNEYLSPGQAEEISRVMRSYPHLID